MFLYLRLRLGVRAVMALCALGTALSLIGMATMVPKDAPPGRRMRLSLSGPFGLGVLTGLSD